MQYVILFVISLLGYNSSIVNAGLPFFKSKNPTPQNMSYEDANKIDEEIRKLYDTLQKGANIDSKQKQGLWQKISELEKQKSSKTNIPTLRQQSIKFSKDAQFHAQSARWDRKIEQANDLNKNIFSRAKAKHNQNMAGVRLGHEKKGIWKNIQEMSEAARSEASRKEAIEQGRNKRWESFKGGTAGLMAGVAGAFKRGPQRNKPTESN